MKRVFLGVGHGGSDSGAIAANGAKEKDFNLTMAQACQAELVRHGVEVRMSRTKDEEDTLSQEVAECNAYGPDLAVDIHNNSYNGKADGAEAFYHYKGGTGKTLAENIIAEVAALGQNSRGAKTRTNSQGKDYYGFIRGTVCPAVIIESAFIDNPEDLKFVDTVPEQQAVGVAIAKGILKTLGIAYMDPAPARPAAVYLVVAGTFSSKADAEAACTKLKADGHHEAEVFELEVRV